MREILIYVVGVSTGVSLMQIAGQVGVWLARRDIRRSEQAPRVDHQEKKTP